MRNQLLLAVAVSGTLPAAAQTGRIAHLSHGGSVSTSTAVADNFGTPPAYFAVDSVRYVSTTTLVTYGKWYWANVSEKERLIHLPEKMSAAAARRYLKQHLELVHPDPYSRLTVKYLGFDSTGRADQPIPTRRNRKKNKAAASRGVSLPPGGAALLLAVLAGAGWLLAGRKPKISFAA